MWIAWVLLAVLALVAAWVMSGNLGKAQAARKPSTGAVVVHWDGPITTQKDACTALAEVLTRHGRSKKLMGVVLSDFRAEMKEHTEQLSDNVELLKELIANQASYRAEIAEQVADMVEDNAAAGEGIAERDQEALAKGRRHLGHLDRELAEMKANLAVNQQLLKAYRADRSEFVAAYAAHVLHGKPTPNAGRGDDLMGLD